MLVDRVASIEDMHHHEYDRIGKKGSGVELIVVGEKEIEGRSEGLGGTFTFCTLGDSLSVEKLLIGEILPTFVGIGSILFHMATNQVLDVGGSAGKEFYLGTIGDQHVWLLCRPDLDWLKSPEAALTLSRAREFASHDQDKQHLVFAPAKYVSQKMLTEQKIPVEFVQLPFLFYEVPQN